MQTSMFYICHWMHPRKLAKVHIFDDKAGEKKKDCHFCIDAWLRTGSLLSLYESGIIHYV